MSKDSLRIVFMGTPDFAVASLDALVKASYNIVGVVTVPDKPAGRGQQIQQSAVKQYAVANNLPVLQPEKLKDEKFISELRSLKADLQIVVAFRMLPEVVWNMPAMGTFNLHGSLLPQYRGAAPINRAIMNGEKETGVTTFFLQQEIDTGKIIFRETTPIGENETAGEVHDRLMHIGAALVIKTVKAIEAGNVSAVSQDTIAGDAELKDAPKIFKDDCKIKWDNDAQQVHNFIRGLSPYPAAWTELKNPDEKLFTLKIYKATIEPTAHIFAAGAIVCDNKNKLRVACSKGFINILELQLAGKKRMSTQELLRGFPISGTWKAL